MDFNFDNLPAKAFSGAIENPEMLNTLASLLVAAPRALSLAEIMAVLAASEVEAPAKTTVRSYLNRLVEEGRASKPSRQTYGPVAADDETTVDESGDDQVADAVDPAAADLSDDPLADLGV